MNRNMKKYPDQLLPFRIDSFNVVIDETGKEFIAEYDGWHFEGKSMKAVVNQILKYIFVGGEE